MIISNQPRQNGAITLFFYRTLDVTVLAGFPIRAVIYLQLDFKCWHITSILWCSHLLLVIAKGVAGFSKKGTLTGQQVLLSDDHHGRH